MQLPAFLNCSGGVCFDVVRDDVYGTSVTLVVVESRHQHHHVLVYNIIVPCLLYDRTQQATISL
jgi:hypothetical protein